MKRVLPFATLIVFIAITSAWLWSRTSTLAWIARGGDGPPTLVMLHGYDSHAEDWLQFEPKWQLPEGTRRLYPQAPWRGVGSHRGWWWLHLEGYVAPGEKFPDLSKSNPGGIKVASRLVRELIVNEKQPLILGGFSQGAMTSAEIAFQTDQELAGLILLSGATVNEGAWAEHFAGRRSLPIFIAHGRQDPTLSFTAMERFQQRLKDFGMDVTWYPFDGGHGIPDDVIQQVNSFVVRLQSAAGRD